MSGGLAVVDVETVRLEPGAQVIWQCALIVDDTEHQWTIRPDLTMADPAALRVNRYYQRTTNLGGNHDEQWASPEIAADDIARLTAGRTLVGACPWFDAAHLEALLRANGRCPAWSHRLLCVETFAAGHLGWAKPRKLSDTAAYLGIDFDPELAHSALGDARTARAVYQSVLSTAWASKDPQAA